MELICIQCPMGCHLKVEKQQEELVVSGNRCPRGKAYAIQESTCPVRTLTTTILIEDGLYACLPVISSKPIRKEKIMDVVRALKTVRVQAPIQREAVLVSNVDGEQTDILASRSMKRR